MTETEWLQSGEPQAMVEFLYDKASDRKLRLFACACCRCIWNFIGDERSSRAVEIAERYADGIASNEELNNAQKAAEDAADHLHREIEFGGSRSAAYAATAARNTVERRMRDTPWLGGEDTASFRLMTASWVAAFAAIAAPVADNPKWPLDDSDDIEQANLLRDIFGNPFRETVIDATCRSTEVMRIAYSIYHNGEFQLMSSLADALERSGCTNDAVLQHCRNSGVHVKGCWLVDLLLGEMTENEWLACKNPELMLKFLGSERSDRKLKLFATGCCRRIWHLLSDVRSRRAVEVLERSADGIVDQYEVALAAQSAHDAAREQLSNNDPHSAAAVANALYPECHHPYDEDYRDQEEEPGNEWKTGSLLNAVDAAFAAAWVLGNAADPDGDSPETWHTAAKTEEAEQCRMLRDIIGNPFCPVHLDRGWLKPEAVLLANEMYHEGNFQRMPELAQYLNTSNVTNLDSVTAHCRDTHAHVKGCWVLDIMLGKEVMIVVDNHK